MSVFFCFYGTITSIEAQSISYLEVSQDLLENCKAGASTQVQEEALKSVSIDALASELTTDAARKAFWINIYNGYIQVILKKNPELYKNKTRFFKRKLVEIMGKKLSFSDIEHGILRRSNVDYMFGYITNPWPPKYERRLRVDTLDARIHFGLNCGAKDCPPVDIYDAHTYDEQIDNNARSYLTKSTEYTDDYKEAQVTSLFSWFRGDFGGYKGIRRFLHRYTDIPKDKTIEKIGFRSYDWTLHLDYYVNQ